MTAEKEQIERDLAEGCEPFRRQRERLRSRFTDLARRVPDGVAVVDFVRYYDWSDPKAAAPGSGPVPRFTAFVLRRDAAAPGYRLARLELGPAAPIDLDVTAWRAWHQAGVRVPAAASSSGTARAASRSTRPRPADGSARRSGCR